MPTPVSAARQCLTEDAARALDEAVAVARRRSHAQTTSIHAVSALLALPNSVLRDACARARSSSYPARLQFRALDLCVGVSLDRLPSSKATEDPQVSNSLMAAIKRSQASQRRHPESYHLHQLHNNSANGGSSSAASVMKVELKYFILSILDDPIVSRIFGEAGFRSCDIKIALLQPPIAQISSRFSRTRCPPIFLCNLTDSDPCSTRGRSGLSFPFSSHEDEIDANHRRICQAMIGKKGKNPLLAGVCAGDALRSFTESLEREKLASLPMELSGLKVVPIDIAISKFDRGSEEKVGAKLKELEQLLENVSGSGVLVNLGDLKELVGDSLAADEVSSIVSKLARLLEIHKGRLWLIGSFASNDLYSKLSRRFPGIEKDWDLQVLPITLSRSPFEGTSKSSLMASFVPFGGFFSTPPDYKLPLSNARQPFSRCHLCNEKYEQELAANLRVSSTALVADQHSENLPPWLQAAALDMSRGGEATKIKDDIAESNVRISALQKKWDDICQELHHPQQLPKIDYLQGMPEVQIPEQSKSLRDKRTYTEGDILTNESRYANQFSGVRTSFSPKCGVTPPMVSTAENIVAQPRLPAEFPKALQIHKKSPSVSQSPQLSPIPNDRCISSLSVLPVTTDSRVGTIDVVSSLEPITPKLQGHKECMLHLSSSVSGEFDADSENVSHQLSRTSPHSGLSSEELMDLRDYKDLRRGLSERIGWQDEAIAAVSHAVSRYRTGYGRYRGSSCKTGLWFTFSGPDRIGKRKVASALAEILFGSQENFILVDFCLKEASSKSNSMFKYQALNIYDDKIQGRQTVFDLIAEELAKKPNSVIFLENLDRADFEVQQRLSDCIATGKFRDPSRREVSVNNTIFITSTVTGGNSICLSEMESLNFSEDLVLGAKRWQMQILVHHAFESQGSDVKVKITGMEKTSKLTCVSKRKLDCISDSMELSRSSTDEQANKVPRSCLDLNLPVAETEEEIHSVDSKSDSISENTETWLEEFLGQVDNKIYFKPLNFDGLAEQAVKQIRLQFETTVGSEAGLEIDQEVVVQVLAAQLLSNMKGTVQEWVESVLSGSFAEAKRKHQLTSLSILKLVACEGILVEEQAPGACLPAKIIVN